MAGFLVFIASFQYFCACIAALIEVVVVVALFLQVCHL